MKFILSSASPRRKLLLSKFGFSFETIPSEVEESFPQNLAAEQVAEMLAERKAAFVAKSSPGAFVLGADTLVVLGRNEILGKPLDRRDAQRMLQSLSGSTHRVITGICLILPDGKKTIEHDTTIVVMRTITESEILGYLDSGEWEGKAGAYAIQESADRFVTSIDGSFDNVVELPTERLKKVLAQFGLIR